MRNKMHSVLYRCCCKGRYFVNIHLKCQGMWSSLETGHPVHSTLEDFVVMCYRNSLFKIIDIVDCVCLPVIYNYDKHLQYDLQLSVGDTVQIKESLTGDCLTGDCLTLLPAWLKSFLFESFCYAMLRRAQHCHGKSSFCLSVCLWHWGIVVM